MMGMLRVYLCPTICSVDQSQPHRQMQTLHHYLLFFLHLSFVEVDSDFAAKAATMMKTTSRDVAADKMRESGSGLDSMRCQSATRKGIDRGAKHARSIAVVVLLLSMCGSALSQGSSPNMATCADQSSCVRFTKQKVSTGPCSPIGQPACTIRVCVETHYGTGSCLAPSNSILSHVCTDGGTSTPTTCSASSGQPFALDMSDRVEGVRTGKKYCVNVQAGQPAFFNLRDGNG
jgi:hypothetical protein